MTKYDFLRCTVIEFSISEPSSLTYECQRYLIFCLNIKLNAQQDRESALLLILVTTHQDTFGFSRIDLDNVSSFQKKFFSYLKHVPPLAFE